MIQNKKIINKVKEKTKEDFVLQKFIIEILENESEGRQYGKFYDLQAQIALDSYEEEADN